MYQVAEYIQTVSNGNHDHATLAEAFAIVAVQVAVTGLMAAAMDVNCYGKFLICILCGSPDIHIETILASLIVTYIKFSRYDTAAFGNKGLLHGKRSELVAGTNAFPGLYGLGILPAKITNGRCRKGNTTENREHLICSRKSFQNAFFNFCL